MSNINWEVDRDHSSVEFSVTHLMINRIKGVFEHFQAILSFDPNDLTTMGIQASIDANSITTRQSQRVPSCNQVSNYYVSKHQLRPCWRKAI